MTATSKLQNRLQFERSVMATEFPQFGLFQINYSVYFQGWYTTSTKHQSYQLQLMIPNYYPDEMPKLYVTHPRTLQKYGWGTINSEGVSHAFHTLSSGPDGCVQICHFKPEHWNASKTCAGVFMKGILWLEAYGAHLTTGKDIARILDEWERRQ